MSMCALAATLPSQPALPLSPLARPLFSPVSLGLYALFSSLLLSSPQCYLSFRRPQFYAPQTLCQVLIKMIHVFIHFTRWLFIQFWFSEHLKNVFSPRPLVRLPFTARSLHPPVACLASQRYFLLAFLVCSHTQNYAPHASLVLLVPCDPQKYSCAESLVFEGLRVVKNRSGGKEVLLHMQVMPHTHYQLFWCALTLKNLFLMPFWCFCCAVTLIHSSVLCFLLFSASFL